MPYIYKALYINMDPMNGPYIYSALYISSLYKFRIYIESMYVGPNLHIYIYIYINIYICVGPLLIAPYRVWLFHVHGPFAVYQGSRTRLRFSSDHLKHSDLYPFTKSRSETIDTVFLGNQKRILNVDCESCMLFCMGEESWHEVKRLKTHRSSQKTCHELLQSLV